MKTLGRFLMCVIIVGLWTLLIPGQSADSAEKEFTINTWKQEFEEINQLLPKFKRVESEINRQLQEQFNKQEPEYPDVRDFLRKHFKKHPTIIEPDSSSQYFLEIVKPPPNIDYKMTNITPDPKIDFKLIVRIQCNASLHAFKMDAQNTMLNDFRLFYTIGIALCLCKTDVPK